MRKLRGGGAHVPQCPIAYNASGISSRKTAVRITEERVCGAVAAAAFVVALLNFEILKLFSSVSTGFS